MNNAEVKQLTNDLQDKLGKIVDSVSTQHTLMKYNEKPAQETFEFNFRIKSNVSNELQREYLLEWVHDVDEIAAKQKLFVMSVSRHEEYETMPPEPGIQIRTTFTVKLCN